MKLNVIIPMAGAGSRFQKAGYQLPKPLIPVNNKPMIQVVIENLNFHHEVTYIFICQREHEEKYQISKLLEQLLPSGCCQVVFTDGLTEGAACTALLAKHCINNKTPLLFANSDQYLEWNGTEFINKISISGADGGLLTFTSEDPSMSFAKLDDNQQWVSEVAEKKPISNHASTGIYYWQHGSDFVKYAEQMIAKNVRVNNEFYVCPVYNEAIADGLKFKIVDCKKMWNLGTPQDLDYYVEHHPNF